MSEASLMRAFLGRASYEFKNFRLFRRNIGVMQVKDRIFKAGIRGQCDLYGYTRSGHVIEIEVKALGKLNPDQERWRDWCRFWGVPWLLLEARKDEFPAQTLDRWIDELRRFLETLASLRSSGCEPTIPATPSAKAHFQRARSMFEESLESEPSRVQLVDKSSDPE